MSTLDTLIRTEIAAHCCEAAGIFQKLRESAELHLQIYAAARLLLSAYAMGFKAIFFGNGGSAQQAEHLAAELLCRFKQDRRGLPALALTGSATLTAIGNDYGYEWIYARQIQALGKPGDVAVGISTSGQSPSVLEGLKRAKNHGLATIGLTSSYDSKMRDKDLVDVCVIVPSTDTARVQEAHLLIGHIWCDLIEKSLEKPTNDVT